MSRAQRALARSQGVATTLASLSLNAQPVAALPVLPQHSPSPSPEPPLPSLPNADSSSRKRGKYNHVTEKIRADIISLHVNNGLQPKDIRGALSTPMRLKTIYHVLSQFRKQQNDDASSDDEKSEASPAKKRGRPNKFTDTEVAYIIQLSDERHDITLKELGEQFHQRFDKTISKACLSGILKKTNSTTKKLVLVPVQRNSAVNIRMRKEYCQQWGNVEANDLLYVDETPFNLHMRRTRGRSRRGRRAIAVRHGASIKRITGVAGRTASASHFSQYAAILTTAVTY